LVSADKDNVVAESDETNNSLENTWNVVPGEPDLVILDKSEAWIDETAGTYEVTYTVKNVGGADAAASTTSISIDGTEEATDAVPALAVDATHANTVGPFTISDSSDTILVSADKDDVVTESDETNNSLENTFSRTGSETMVEGTVPGGWVSITVPDKVVIDITKGQVNSAACDVDVDSNDQWQLDVEDKEPLPNKGHMVSGSNVLANSMELVPGGGSALDLATGKHTVDTGAGPETVGTTLNQMVEYTDKAGLYGMTITFTAFGTW
jgi:hypothetical protein